MKAPGVLFLFVLAGFAFAAEQELLTFDKAIPLAGVKGRQLFIAALGNDTVEILDLKSGQRVRSITGCHKPQGVLFLQDSKRICVANGSDGTVQFHDAASGTLIKQLDSMDDADNVRFDEKTKTIYVGYGGGALALISAESFQKTGDIKLAGHPESFQLEQDGPRIFVNVPDAGHVAVVDRAKKLVIATWPFTGYKSNFPLALDEKHQRLFVGCRKPARLVVLDTNDGHIVTNVTVSGDTDDLFYDAARRRIYLSGGEGFLDIIGQSGPDVYQARTRIATSSGARTCFFNAASSELFLAVPIRGNKGAEILVYQATP